MSFVVGAAAHGSPGVSTAMQLVAALWPHNAAVPVVVEADATGGVLAARYEISLNPGFVTLAESLRKFEAPPLIEHAQRLPSGVACVPLSPSATAAGAQLRSAGPYLGPYLAQSGHPVLLDVGTLVPDGKAVASVTAADLMLWFVRPTREELLVLRHRLAECAQPDNVGIVLVGETPYNAEQVSDAIGVEVLHTLPIDRRGATAVNLGGDDRFLRRSQLARSCTQLASLISSRVGAGSATAEADASEAPPAPPAEISDVATSATAPPAVAESAAADASEASTQGSTTPPPPAVATTPPSAPTPPPPSASPQSATTPPPAPTPPPPSASASPSPPSPSPSLASSVREFDGSEHVADGGDIDDVAPAQPAPPPPAPPAEPAAPSGGASDSVATNGSDDPLPVWQPDSAPQGEPGSSEAGQPQAETESSAPSPQIGDDGLVVWVNEAH